jgi:integrase
VAGIIHNPVDAVRISHRAILKLNSMAALVKMNLLSAPTLSIVPSRDTMPPTGNAPRRIRMGARHQTGSLEVSGNWIYGRFRTDTPEGRRLITVRICPSSGHGLLGIGEQKRRLAEALSAHGVNNKQKMVESNSGTTFREQAAWYLNDLQTREDPASPSTIATFTSGIETWLKPQLGDTLLADINNASAKRLVAAMVKGGLGAKTINFHLTLMKQIVASAIHPETLEPLFPRKWASRRVLNAPRVEKQNRPTFSEEQITRLIANAHGRDRMLYVFLAASGVRISEAFGLSIENVSSDGRTVNITQSVYRGKITDRLKTAAAERQIDLDPRVGSMLREYLGSRTSGLVFASRTGRPLNQSNFLGKTLHPALDAIGVKHMGAHAFRRFRKTHLGKMGVNDALARFWLGHADEDVHQGYDRVREDVAYRLEQAALAGV